MRIDKVVISNLYGIRGSKEIDISMSILALWGANGIGKTSVIESIRFAITGAGKVNVLHAGETDGFVEIAFGEHSVRRIVSFYEGKYKLQTFVDGRKVSTKAAEQFLAEQFQSKSSDIKLLTSKNLTSSLESGAGDLLMSYMDNSIPREDVISMVLSHNPGNKHLTEDVVRTYGMQILPENVDYAAITALLKSERDNRRITKKEGDNLTAKLRNMDASGAQYDLETLTKELESLQNLQAASKAALEAAKQMEAVAKKRETTLSTIASLKKEKDQIEMVMKELSKDDPSKFEDAENSKTELSRRISETQEKIHLNEKDLAVIESDLAWIHDISGKLQTGGCPFSSEKLPIKCSTDMSPILSDLEAREKESADRKNRLETETGKLKKDLTGHSAELSRLDMYLNESAKKKNVEQRIAELEAALPKEPEQIKTDPTDYSKQIQEIQNKIFHANKYREVVETKQEVQKLAQKWYLCDAFVRIFADDGPVVSLLVEEYRKLLTEAANSISDITGISVKFITGKGIDMLFCTQGTEYRPYTSLSAGEQVLAYITITDMLSRLSGYHLLVIDDMDKLDNKNLECVIRLLSENVSGYENVIIAGVDHDGTEEILEKYQVCRA